MYPSGTAGADFDDDEYDTLSAISGETDMSTDDVCALKHSNTGSSNDSQYESIGTSVTPPSATRYSGSFLNHRILKAADRPDRKFRRRASLELPAYVSQPAKAWSSTPFSEVIESTEEKSKASAVLDRLSVRFTSGGRDLMRNVNMSGDVSSLRRAATGSRAEDSCDTQSGTPWFHRSLNSLDESVGTEYGHDYTQALAEEPGLLQELGDSFEGSSDEAEDMGTPRGREFPRRKVFGEGRLDSIDRRETSSSRQGGILRRSFRGRSSTDGIQRQESGLTRFFKSSKRIDGRESFKMGKKSLPVQPAEKRGIKGMFSRVFSKPTSDRSDSFFSRESNGKTRLSSLVGRKGHKQQFARVDDFCENIGSSSSDESIDMGVTKNKVKAVHTEDIGCFGGVTRTDMKAVETRDMTIPFKDMDLSIIEVKGLPFAISKKAIQRTKTARSILRKSFKELNQATKDTLGEAAAIVQEGRGRNRGVAVPQSEGGLLFNELKLRANGRQPNHPPAREETMSDDYEELEPLSRRDSDSAISEACSSVEVLDVDLFLNEFEEVRQVVAGLSIR
eukprot:CAMPEP_0198722690 /NCGR_PEP_ID=MMETSP1475-20131203/314_1 /TAXON_ID= ORGANISM="Unidentified sp., Strain CCMP1999" /NCGR_SAMPLE_ID=MMETSP1475 /ASSEMBLY_ACC=CAM_ASM_001111 /LENGTH=560 /DNA_ID=CAMNT_0044483603 /DNA_START=132 /DNA_END=1814 /DNA_ORIENTATION=-